MAKSLDLNVILAARDKITAPLKKINATSTGTARAIKRSQQEIKGLKSAQRDISAFRKMEGALRDNSRALDEAQERQRKLGNALRNTKTPTEQMRKQYRKARGDVERFTRKGQDQRKELGRVRKSLKEAGIDSRNLGEAQAKLENRMEAANKRIKRQQKYLAQLGNADISGKFGKMAGEVGKFGRRAAMLGGGAAAGIFGIANSTASLGDEVAKTGDKIGIALGPFQELRYAAERSGVSTQKFDSSLERFVKRMGEATQGTGAAKKAYEELGLSAANLSKMTPEDSLAVVADRLNSVENQSQRVAIAAQLFGREGVAMVNMMKDGSAGLKALRKDARDTGYAMTDGAARGSEQFKDALLDVQLGMKGMKNVIGAELQPALTSLMKDLFGWIKENKSQVQEFASQFGERLKAAIPVVKDVALGVASMAKGIATVTGHMAGLVGGFDNLGMVLAAVFAMKPVMAMLAFGKSIAIGAHAVLGFTGALPYLQAGLSKALLGFKWLGNGAKAILPKAGALFLKFGKGLISVLGAAGKALWGFIATLTKGLVYALGVTVKAMWAFTAGASKMAFAASIKIGKTLVTALSVAGKAMWGFTAGLAKMGVALLANPITWIVGGIAAAVAGAAYLIYKNWDGISGWFSDRWKDIKTAFSGGLAGIGKLILNWSPLGLFYKAFSGVMSWFGVDLPDSFTGFGKQILDGLVGGLVGGLKKVKDTIVNAGAKTIGWFKETLGIKSPSRVFMAAGNDTLEGYRRGLAQKEPEALKQVNSFGKRMRSAGAGIAMGAAAMPVAAGTVQVDSRPPVAAPTAQAAPAGGDNITINVYPQPEQNAQDIAAEIHRVLAERDRMKARRAGSALYDRE